MQYSISSYTCFSLLQPKRNSSVGNDKYKRLEIYTDSTLDTEASLKLPWSLAKQSWQSSLAVKIKLPQPCVWWCLLMYEIWVTILQYEGAGSCCVRATSVDVMIIIIINFLHNTAQLYLTVHGFCAVMLQPCKVGTMDNANPPSKPPAVPKKLGRGFHMFAQMHWSAQLPLVNFPVISSLLARLHSIAQM